jgi:hypothetical protein
MALKLIIFSKRKNKLESGQSFIELLLIFPVLMVLLTGMVEFGYMFNVYINLMDAAREGARAGSTIDAFCLPAPSCGVNNNLFIEVDNQIEGPPDTEGDIYGPRSGGTLSPIHLNPTDVRCLEFCDDIVISIFSINENGSITRYPGDFGDNIYSNQTSRFTTTKVTSRLNSLAPKSGLLLVEIYYRSYQLLNLFAYFGLPNPVELYAYSFMPLPSAEPLTQLPKYNIATIAY